MGSKVLLVGWDAADWKIIQPLMDAGLMPTTQRLVEGGVMSDLLTLSPILSPVLWTSIATGKRPYKHGILGFTEPTATGTGVQPITNLSRKTKAVWNILNQNGLRSNVISWWPSSPVEPINGVMVSDHFHAAPEPNSESWPIPPHSIHPPELAAELAELRIHPEDLTADELAPFVPEGHAVDQAADRRLSAVMKIVAEAATVQACALHLMEREPWDFTAVYFDAIDHFCHGFMKYHPPRLEWVSEEDYRLYKNVVSAGYVFHDMMLANLLEKAGEDATVILVSDHGFHPDHMRQRELPNEPAGPANEHREHGVFLMHGPGVRQDALIHGTSLLDVTPTILSVFGLPAGKDMDGRVLAEVYSDPDVQQAIPSWDDVPGEDGRHPEGFELDVNAAAESVEQLVALGYIDRPSGDGREAAEKAARENQFNLARSYMHAGMHGEAIPILSSLYQVSPLEFRFGIQLALCLQALQRVEELAELVADIRARWRSAALVCRERLEEISEISEERKRLADQLQQERAAVMEESAEAEAAPEPEPRLFSDAEQAVIRKLRSIARGNIHVLDYMDGWVAMARGDHEAALVLFQQYEQVQAAATGLHFQLAEAYRELGRHDEALVSYSNALNLDPHDAGALLGVARTRYAMGDFENALAEARAALALKYHQPMAHYLVALCEEQRGNRAAALAAMDTATTINPNFPEAWESLAEWQRGDSPAAEDYRRRAADIREQFSRRQPVSLFDKLPRYDDINYEGELPVFPVSSILPRLADPDVEATDDTSGRKVITVISGLPRSGTSMLLQMLQAAGQEILTDGERAADDNNPRGYFELEKAKRLPQANDWLEDARGKAVKVVTPLLPYLPQGENYRVILMQRNYLEIARSQLTMLGRDGKTGGALTEDQLIAVMERQDQFAQTLLEKRGIPVLKVSHGDAIADAGATAGRIARFIGLSDPEPTEAMSSTVDASLYRERLGGAG